MGPKSVLCLLLIPCVFVGVCAECYVFVSMFFENVTILTTK